MTARCPLFTPGTRINATMFAMGGTLYERGGTYLHRDGLDANDANGCIVQEYSYIQLDCEDGERRIHNRCITPMDTPNHPAWPSMLKTHDIARLPKVYRDDLYLHDRSWLSMYPDAHFIWVIREHGTHIVSRDWHHGALKFETVANQFTYDGPQWYYAWNGVELIPMDKDHAKDFLDNLDHKYWMAQ